MFGQYLFICCWEEKTKYYIIIVFDAQKKQPLFHKKMRFMRCLSLAPRTWKYQLELNRSFSMVSIMRILPFPFEFYTKSCYSTLIIKEICPYEDGKRFVSVTSGKLQHVFCLYVVLGQRCWLTYHTAKLSSTTHTLHLLSPSIDEELLIYSSCMLAQMKPMYPRSHRRHMHTYRKRKRVSFWLSTGIKSSRLKSGEQ